MRLLVTQLTVLSTVYCLMVSHKGDAEYRICTASDYLLKLCKAFFLLLLQILITHMKCNTKALLHLCKHWFKKSNKVWKHRDTKIGTLTKKSEKQVWWHQISFIHWPQKIWRELGFLFLIYITGAEYLHLIEQLAYASTDIQSYSSLSIIPQRQWCEDACYEEPYVWQRLNYHQALTKDRERTICKHIHYEIVCLHQTYLYVPACLNKHIRM